MPSFFPQWVQDINTALGYVGFAITLYVLVTVRSIKRTFLSRVRLPKVIRDLEEAGSALNNSLGSWPSGKTQAQCQIKIAASLLKSVATLLPRNERKETSRIHEKLRLAGQEFDQPKFSRADPVWDLYSDIQSSITSLRQASENLKWE